MKTHNIRKAIACCLLALGAITAISQESQPVDPIVVKLADIQREDFTFRPFRGGDGDVELCVFFERKGKAEVDALREEGMRANRPVHVFDGTNLVAKCRLVGGATSQKRDGEILGHGMILGFDSMADAERAATAMSEHWEDYIRRRIDYRRTWRVSTLAERIESSPKLEGTWSCVSATVDGKPLPEATVKLLRLTLTKDRYKTERGDETLLDSSYKLDRSQSPPQIDILGTEGDLKGKVAQGIYSIAGDTLKICYTMPGKKRPTAFASAAGSEAHFIVWQWQKP